MKEGYLFSVEKPLLEKFLSLCIAILLCLLGFFAGLYWQNSTKETSVVVNLSPVQVAETPVISKTLETPGTSCAFVASKKGEKYHSGSSFVAKQIKPENLLCFESKEAAETAGLVSGVME